MSRRQQKDQPADYHGESAARLAKKLVRSMAKLGSQDTNSSEQRMMESAGFVLSGAGEGVAVYDKAIDEDNFVIVVMIGDSRQRSELKVSTLFRYENSRIFKETCDVNLAPVSPPKLSIADYSHEEPISEAMHLPPRLAEFAFYLIVRDKEKRSIILGDLAEQYADVYSKFSPRMAAFFYWEQTCLSFGPLIWQTITKVVQVYRWFAKS